jgi:hypothetical protein
VVHGAAMDMEGAVLTVCGGVFAGCVSQALNGIRRSPSRRRARQVNELPRNIVVVERPERRPSLILHAERGPSNGRS